jgi:hypothetical protein
MGVKGEAAGFNGVAFQRPLHRHRIHFSFNDYYFF